MTHVWIFLAGVATGAVAWGLCITRLWWQVDIVDRGDR